MECHSQSHPTFSLPQSCNLAMYPYIVEWHGIQICKCITINLSSFFFSDKAGFMHLCASLCISLLPSINPRLAYVHGSCYWMLGCFDSVFQTLDWLIFIKWNLIRWSSSYSLGLEINYPIAGLLPIFLLWNLNCCLTLNRVKFLLKKGDEQSSSRIASSNREHEEDCLRQHGCTSLHLHLLN